MLFNFRHCHVVTFFFMFGYLFVFRLTDKFGLPPPSGQTNLIEMVIVLRVVGVAFEVNGSYLAMKKLKQKETKEVEGSVSDKDIIAKDGKDEGARQRKVKGQDVKDKKEHDNKPEKDDDFVELIDPEFIDLFHYTFNYIGLLTGTVYNIINFNLMICTRLL